MSDYTVSGTLTTWDGRYTAAGLGYIHDDGGGYALVTGSGTRQYYTLDADPTYIMVYDIDTGYWVLTETSSFPFDYFINNSGTTPPVDEYWGAAYVEAFTLEMSAETNIEFEVGTHLTFEAVAESNIEFDTEQEGVRVVYAEGESSIEFDEAVAQIRFSETGIELSHSASAFVNKAVKQDIVFSDSAIREPMSFNRSAHTNIEFEDFGSAFDTSDNAYGPCDDEYICDRDHITLSCADPVTSVDLRNPSDDSLGVILNTINRYSRAEELREVGVHPRFLQLHYDFTSMPASQKDAFIAFFKATAGLEITLTDFCNQTWIGCILNKEIDFDREQGHIELDPLCPETDDGLYAWKFIFEGERV